MVPGKVQGNQFELIFEKQCRMQGIAYRKVPMSCKWMGLGNLQLMESELDYIAIHNGVCAFVDTKTFEGDKFVYSDIKQHQLKTALFYNEYKVKAGYLVWFRKENAVCFFMGTFLEEVKPRESRWWYEGEYLGTYEEFCLGNLFI